MLFALHFLSILSIDTKSSMMGMGGQGRRKWEYFAVLEELFAGDPAVQPTVVISSTPTFTTPPPPPPPDQETPSTSATMTTPPVKPKTKKDKLDDKLEEIIKLQKETIAFQKERNDILRQFTAAMVRMSQGNEQ